MYGYVDQCCCYFCYFCSLLGVSRVGPALHETVQTSTTHNGIPRGEAVHKYTHTHAHTHTHKCVLLYAYTNLHHGAGNCIPERTYVRL